MQKRVGIIAVFLSMEPFLFYWKALSVIAAKDFKIAQTPTGAEN